MRQGLQYLDSLPPWNGQGGFDVENVRRAAELWGNPQDKVKSVHIGGTNGKGSVSVFISSILGAAGYSVGLTTSPHLSQLNERIVIDGVAASDAEIEQSAATLSEIARSNEIALSFFEAITLVFFDICRARKVDWMVVEVGLGGRLDATNIINDPSICGIVTVAMDHAEILGNSERLIAREKAGIIKRNVPVVIGAISKEPKEEIEKIASGLRAPIFSFGTDFSCDRVEKETGSVRVGEFIYHEGEGKSLVLSPELLGVHQGHNAAVAAKIGSLLQISPLSIQAGISNARWPGRLEMIRYKQRDFLFDAGHNPAGIRTLVDYIKTEYNQEVDILFGVINTKDWKEMIEFLLPISRSWGLFRPQSNAAVPCTLIAEYLSSIGVSSTVFDERFDEGLQHAVQSTDALGRSTPVVVVGSIYLIGAVRELVGAKMPPLWRTTVGLRHAPTLGE